MLLTVCILFCANPTTLAASGEKGQSTSRLRETVTIAAVGDILLDREVATEIRRHGYAYPFAHVRTALRQADIAFGNLECPLSSRPIRSHKLVAFAAAPETARCLTDGGLDLLSLANNHAMDCGQDGLADTMDTLRRQGIHWCGAGSTADEAMKPAIVTIRGVRIAFVGFCEFPPEGIAVRADRPAMAMATEVRVRAAVTAARARADIVVASFHWGIEFTDHPAGLQRHLAHAAAEAGADLVLGHHPHVLQGIEVIRTGKRVCLAAYSLGNFVFDQRLTASDAPESTVILKLVVDRAGVRSVSFEPMRIRHCAPEPATGPDAARIAARLSALSDDLGTAMRNRHVDLPASPRRRPARD